MMPRLDAPVDAVTISLVGPHHPQAVYEAKRRTLAAVLEENMHRLTVERYLLATAITFTAFSGLLTFLS